MEQVLKWKANSIPTRRWKKSIFYQRFHTDIADTKRLYEKVQKELNKRVKQVAIWKKTRDVSVYHKTVQETKQKYAKAVAAFLAHPETSTLQEQNQLLGSTMRSSLTSMGIIPTLQDGTIRIHSKYT